MAKATTIKEAIQNFERAHGVSAEEAEKVELFGQCPPIEKMDSSLSNLENCKHLALSTNNIDRISNLQGLDNLKILSVGRNSIPRLENLDPIAGTLEQLWASYNQISSLAGVEKLTKLRVLYASNNRLDKMREVDRLKGLPLEDLLLVGNPIYDQHANSDSVHPSKVPSKTGGSTSPYRLEILKRCPGLKRLDGIPVEPEERDAVSQGADDSASATGEDLSRGVEGMNHE